jgi:hypothetical protein
MRAVLDAGLEQISEAVSDATRAVGLTAGRGAGWIDRVRAGLVALLGFLDDEPEWAWRLFCEPGFEVDAAFVWEMRLLGVLTGLLDDGAPRPVGEFALEPGLLGEFVAGSVFAVIRAQLHEVRTGVDGRLLVELTPSLLAFVAMPYLGQAAASAELACSVGGSGERLGLQKRSLAATEVVFVPATGTYLCVDRGSRRGVSSQTGGVGRSPGGGLADRSLCNREDKGVVDK